jgi:fatty acid desaturase
MQTDPERLTTSRTSAILPRTMEQQPPKGRVYAVPVVDVLLTYALLFGSTAGGALLASWAIRSAPAGGRLLAWAISCAVALPVALLNSLSLHRLGLFVHAASHWEMASSRALSDRLFNLLIAWFLGIDMAGYRKKHFTHHQRLGEADDPEDDYTPPFSWTRVKQVLTNRDSLKGPATGEKQRTIFQPMSKLVHFAILVALVALRDPIFALVAWAVPVMVGLPLAVYVRNFCEHHPLPGEASVARDFSGGLDAFFLGAAGFRRHHQHHRRPAILYWELGAGSADPPPQSYLSTFIRLVRRREDRQ